MAKRRSASSVLDRQVGKSARHIPDSGIDFSAIPESTDLELRRARPVGRPCSGEAKHLIAIRIHPRVLAKLRKLAQQQQKPYQTLIHEILGKCLAPGDNMPHLQGSKDSKNLQRAVAASPPGPQPHQPQVRLRDSSSSLSLGGAFFHVLRHWLNSYNP